MTDSCTSPMIGLIFALKCPPLAALIILIVFGQISTQNPLVSPPTVFTQQPIAGSAEFQGNTKVLLCHATGFPTPVYRWLKDSHFLKPGNVTDTSLKMPNIQRSDAGKYQCVASNAHGALLSIPAEVKVAYMDPFPKTGDQEKSVDQGQARIIDLPPIDSFPKPRIQWFWGSQSPVLTEMQRYQVTLDDQLVILGTSLSDKDQVYRATAMNSYTGQSTDSQTFILKVQNVGEMEKELSPQIVVPPKDTTVVQGDDAQVKFECVANARPLNDLSLHWYQIRGLQRKEIQPQGVKYLISGYRRTLTIKNPETSDSGMYECEAALRSSGPLQHPEATARANLTVFVKPSFSSPPVVSLEKHYGDNVTLSCQAVGTPKPTVVWYRNAKLISKLHDTRYTQAPSGDLRLVDVKPNDSGMFQCFVSNLAGLKDAATRLKILSFPPSISQGPANQTGIAGEAVTMYCKVDGAPRPIVSWYRVLENGRSEDIHSSVVAMTITNDRLVISSPQVSDSGLYVCNTSNSKGIDTKHAYLNILSKTKIVDPPKDVEVIKGSTAEIKCGVIYDPDITVRWTWMFEDRLISPSDSRRTILSSGSLQIREARNTDIGRYICMVWSDGGNQTDSAHLKLVELPHPPSIISIKLSQVSTRAVELTWASNFNGNSKILAYVIEKRVVYSGHHMMPNEGWDINTVRVPHPRMSFAVDELVPSRRYQFRIRAENRVGLGTASQPSDEITLPEQPPSGPPLGLVGSARSESSIIIQWKPPDESQWNGPLQGYVIRYQPLGPDSSVSYVNTSSFSVPLYELNELIVFQQYLIAVAAYNKKGLGVFSENINVGTMQGRPAVPPRDVRAVSGSPTSISLTYLPPDPQQLNGINQGYKIRMWLADLPGQPMIRQLNILSNTSNMLGLQNVPINDLKKFTRYNISVLCYTIKGDGPESLPVTIRTVEDVPDAVPSLSFSNVLDKSIDVSWTRPPRINGVLVGYKLSFMRKNQTISKVTDTLGPSMLNATIKGLTASTLYTVEIVAMSRVGHGPVTSQDIESGVPPKKPGAPTKLSISDVKAVSCLLSFRQGFDGHTSISRWLVQAQLNNNQTWVQIYQIHAPDAESIVVQSLRPFTSYRLRLIAENIAGRSLTSNVSRSFRTMPAPPAAALKEFSVRALNGTALRVRWKPLPEEMWHGIGNGYSVKLILGNETLREEQIENQNANSFTFGGLEEFRMYSVQLACYNNVGSSGYGPSVTEMTRESTPSSGPETVNAYAVNSTAIIVEWTKVPESSENGFVLGYKILYSVAGESRPHVVVERPSARSALITRLLKFTFYKVAVLAFTRIGDGITANVSKTVRTNGDVPGPPSSVYFDQVSFNAARINWRLPRLPNGLVNGYRLSYRLKNEPRSSATHRDNLPVGQNSLFVTDLKRLSYYVFELTAKTDSGWGEIITAELFTITNRRLPSAPSRPVVIESELLAHQATISWVTAEDSDSPIRNVSVQFREGSGPWMTEPEPVMPSYSQHAVTRLKPNSVYRFRVAASNDVGRGPYSPSSEPSTTKMAAPDDVPQDVRVVPKTPTSVYVSWKPPPDDTWNGAPLGFQVWFNTLKLNRAESTNDPVTITYPITNVELTKLQNGTYYEFKVNCFNSKGHGPFSSPVDVFVGEAVPTESPNDLETVALSGTNIKVTWRSPVQKSWNADLLGYKIFYWPSDDVTRTKVKAVSVTESQAVISGLEMFTEYSIIMLAFNAAGDGPNTTLSVRETTQQGIPGSPKELSFVMLRPREGNLSWLPPEKPNGLITAYQVTYKYSNGQGPSLSQKLSGNAHYYVAKGLQQDATVQFEVKASTELGWGQGRSANMTAGPQEGAPGAPSQPVLKVDNQFVSLSWNLQDAGNSALRGFIIELQERGEQEWRTVLETKDTRQEATISLLNLKPSAEYRFRVIAKNSLGIGKMSKPSGFTQAFRTEQKPFYQQWWFLVIVALTGIILIIIVISLLCLTGRGRKKSKYRDAIPKTTIRLEESPRTPEDGDFSTYHYRQSQRRSARSKSNRGLPSYARSPPRPSPGMVNYCAEDAKGFDEEGSSLTDKPEDMSSTASTECPSESESEMDKDLPPPPFPNHYANGSVRQSWHRNNTNNAYGGGYSDSEHDSNYAVSLNGGHMLMNNMAGSRAPLPGFSSFV